MNMEMKGYGETERGKRRTIGMIGESSRFHNGSFQSVDTKDVSCRHLVHSDNLATHEEEAIHE